tara:strand:+ start:1382 stop:1702 length:321 start_codon:yes stop_codon:yes gene_type:complete
MTKQSSMKDAAYKLFFSSLANTNRLAIINVLRAKRRNVSEICQETGFEQTMISHNLKRLERCGMVFSEKKGKHRYYSVNNETIKPLLGMIDKHMKKYCCKVLERRK